MLELDKIYCMDVLDGLRSLPDESVDCCVTSPPYWGLRDYNVNGQIGQEATLNEFIDTLVTVFYEVKRVLKSDGTCWINMGDVYKDKVLSGAPWKMAFALHDGGWYLRQDIVWSKTNAMPESVTDRCTRSHEFIFMFSKNKRYFYDAEAIRTPAKESSINRLSQNIEEQAGSARVQGKTNGPMKAVGKQRGHSRRHAGFNERWDSMSVKEQMAMGANRRSVWEMATAMYSEAHFATFPEELPRLCIAAGCPIDGIVLDPFMGSGTTALVASKLQRRFIGFELNPDYVAIAEKRLINTLGLFSPISIKNHNAR